MKPLNALARSCVAFVLCVPSVLFTAAPVPPLTLTESNRLAAALAAIEPHATNIMPHSNLGILLDDATAKDTLAGGCCPTTVPLYERVARALTNACIHPATNLIK